MVYYADGFHNHLTYGYSVVNSKNELIETEEFVKGSWHDGTNNIAEYLGVLKACELAGKGDLIISDSMLVVQQVNGRWKVKCDHLLPYCLNVKKIKAQKNLTIKWLRREKNLAGHFNERLKKD